MCSKLSNRANSYEVGLIYQKTQLSRTYKLYTSTLFLKFSNTNVLTLDRFIALGQDIFSCVVSSNVQRRRLFFSQKRRIMFAITVKELRIMFVSCE